MEHEESHSPEIDAEDEVSKRLQSLPRAELYKIWLELYGDKSTTKSFVNADFEKWRSDSHKWAVALDFASYIAILPIWLASEVPTIDLSWPLLLLPLIAYLIKKRVPDNHPFGIVGIISYFKNLSDSPSYSKNKANPSIDEVNLYTLPVMARAAEKIIHPTSRKIRAELHQLEIYRNSIESDAIELRNLKKEVDQEIVRSNQDWQAILEPKRKRIARLLDEDESQIQHIKRVEQALSSQLKNIEEQLDQLVSRKILMEKLEKLEEFQTPNELPDELHVNIINNLIKVSESAHEGLSEAQNIATAHEQAKAEIAQLLDN